MKNGFEKRYPYLHLYVNYQGWLVIGPDEHFNSWVRILDQGGMHLELDEKTLDASLDKAEAWAEEWMTKHYVKEVKAMLEEKT